MTVDGKRIQELRNAKGYSLIKLAEMAGVGKNTLHDIEHNRANPSISTLNKIATALNVDPKKLLLGG
ncbi:MAG: helix-turn-helix domain-containing protein [Thermincolia bacterium]